MGPRAKAGRWAWLSILPTLHAALPLAGQAPGSGWPTTDWFVDCYAPTERDWSGGHETPGFAEYDALVQMMIDAGECDSTEEGAPAQEVRQLLRDISVWLESQGVPPPLVGRDIVRNAYEAYLIPWGDDFNPATACYHGQCIRNRPAYLFRGRSPELDGPNLLLVKNDPKDVAHELFHAVQHAFPGVERTPENAWIIEGTAEAVGLTWQARVQGRDLPLRTRSYSETLPRQVDELGAYDDEAFWRAVAREYEGGATYGFLIPLLEQGLPGDGLLQSHRGLERLGGLGEVFTRVVARQLLEERFYSAPAVLRLSNETRERDSVSVRGTVTRIAAEAHRVVATVPTGGLARLTLRISPDHPDLRLVVDSERHDPPYGRNVFRTALRGESEPHELFVRVVNVAQDPPATQDRPYELGATLEVAKGVVSYSGLYTGSYSIEGGRGLSFSVFTGAGEHPQACTATLMLASEDSKDLVIVGAVLARPLRPGTFPMEDFANRGRASLPPGLATVQARPSCDRPGLDCRSGLPVAQARGGTLELTRVNDDIVEGRFRAPVGNAGSEPPHSVVEGYFVAALTNVVGWRLAPDHPCRPR